VILSGFLRRHLPTLLILVAAIIAPETVRAQYFFNGTTQEPDSSAVLPLQKNSFPILTGDIRSAGMGLTSVADTLALNAIQINPALLAGGNGFSGSISAYGASPSTTIDAVSFLTDHEGEFINGSSAEMVYDLLQEYAQNPAVGPQLGAAIQELLRVPQELVEKAIGDPDNPNENGANLAGNVQVRIGSFGASLMGYGQTGFVINLGSVYRELFDIIRTTDFQDTTEVIEAITRLQGITDFVIDPLTGTLSKSALPAIYAVSYADVVGTLGYGFRINDAFDVGFNLKVLNRRFSFDRLSVNNAQDIAQDFLSDLETGTTGVTADLGVMIRPTPRIEIGVSLQNIVPFQTIGSSYDFNTTQTRVVRQLDANGNPVVNGNGDTSLVAFVRNIMVHGPASLDLPFVATTGVAFHALDDLDFTFEWVDMLAHQDVRYDTYADRFRLGTEYRLRIPGNILMIPVRMGLAEGLPTFGVGVSLANILQVDFAYFTSNLRKSRSYGFQARLNW